MVGSRRPKVLSVVTYATAGLVLGLLFAAGGITIVTPASAQAFGWLGKLFGGGQPHSAPQSGAPNTDRQDYGYRTRPRSPRHRVAEPARALREKDRAQRNASTFVYVLGDGLGQNLASGLDEAMADRQDVAIVHKTKGSTGLAASDGFDWLKTIDAMVAAKAEAPKDYSPPAQTEALGADKTASAVASTAKADFSSIDVAVMMIGSNDRQPIRLGSEILKPGTREWTVEYRKRVTAIDESFRRKGIPLIWVGVPIARDDGFADDMAAFNDIYREAASKTGTVYVDTWEAFSDDNGEFRAVGPDINGQMTRLRMADGVYFTKAGSRKLAHFVEIHVRRALDGKMARPPIPDTPQSNVALAHKSDIGPINNLTEPPLSRGGQLSAAYRPDAQNEPSTAQGSLSAAPAGRADDLTWPATGMPDR